MGVTPGWLIPGEGRGGEGRGGNSWVVKAEKYCTAELHKCSSMEEAKDLYDLHQVKYVDVILFPSYSNFVKSTSVH